MEKSAESKKKKVSVSIPKENHEFLEKHALRYGISETELINVLIREEMQRFEN